MPSSILSPFDPYVVLRRLSPSLAALLAVAFVSALASTASAQYPDPDRYRLQWSARLINGFGFSRGIPHQGLLGDTGVRADFLWGKPGDEHFRFGPALDLRSACTLPILVSCIHPMTIEFGAGGTVLIPFRRGYPITITPAVGYAFRRNEFGGDGLFLSNTFAWGYRPYNYFHRYGYGIEAFVSHRMHLDDPSAWELTFGIEFDLELAIWVPILMLRMAIQNDDPDEPEEDEDDPAERDVGGASTGRTSAGSTAAAGADASDAPPAEGTTVPAAE